MLRFFCVVLSLACSVPALAQSHWEIFGGGSYARADIPTQTKSNYLNSYGYEASVGEYPYRSPYRWFGATIEHSGYFARPTVATSSGTRNDLLNEKTFTFLFGPSIEVPRQSYSNHLLRPRAATTWRHLTEHPFGFTPSAHVLLGAVTEQVTATSKGEVVVGRTYNTSQTVFGAAFGGGVDVPFTSRWSVRGQADWLRSSFKNGVDDRQNSLRVSVGLVFRPHS